MKRLDEKDIARFEFVPVSKSRLRLKEGFVSYNTSEGKRAYGKLERVGDELYLKDIKSDKRTAKIDEENIARFDFVQASQYDIDHATNNIKKITSPSVTQFHSASGGGDLAMFLAISLLGVSGGIAMIKGIGWLMGLFL